MFLATQRIDILVSTENKLICILLVVVSERKKLLYKCLKNWYDSVNKLKPCIKHKYIFRSTEGFYCNQLEVPLQNKKYEKIDSEIVREGIVKSTR